MELEIFKPIPGYEKEYEISKEGTLRSLRFRSKKILQPNSKYKYYLLYKNQKSITMTSKSLIAATFDGKKLKINTRGRLPFMEIDEELIPILDKVCSIYHINNKEIQSLSNIESIRESRQLIQYIGAKHTKLDYFKIAQMIGGKNRTSVYHSIKKINNLLSTDKKFKEMYRNIIIDLYDIDLFEPALKLKDAYNLVEECFGINGLARFREQYKTIIV